jgi:hypothetical protein
MARKGQTNSQVPTLYHTGIGGLFAVTRKRRNDKKYRRREYRSLTNASASRASYLMLSGRLEIRYSADLAIFNSLIFKRS